jgi:hypothetical protein
MSTSTLFSPENLLAFISALFCVIAVTTIVVIVRNRLPLNFAVNLGFYTLAILSRAVNALAFNKSADNPIRIIISGICVGLIELSLQWLTFQVLIFEAKISSHTVEENFRRLKRIKIIRFFVMTISLVTSLVKVWVEYEEFSEFRDLNNHMLIHKTYMKIILVILYSLRMATLLYILLRLLLSIFFFLKLKKKALSA